MSNRNISCGVKGGRCVGLTNLLPSCANCLEIWESQTPGTRRNCLGLSRICFRLPFYLYLRLFCFCFLCWRRPSYLTNCASVKYVGWFPDTVYQDLALLWNHSTKICRSFNYLTRSHPVSCVQDWFQEACPESIQPFWMSREPVAWPWCNLAANQRRPYCAFVNSHSSVGLVSRQRDTVDWACVLCELRFHNDRASRSANLHQCACPFYRYHAGSFFFLKISHNPGLSVPLQPRFASLRLLVFPKAKITIESEEICGVLLWFDSLVMIPCGPKHVAVLNGIL